MAILSSSDLSAAGLDIESIKQSIGPSKVVNRKDGTVEIELPGINDIISLIKYLRALDQGTNKNSVLRRMGFARVKPSNSTGTHE